MDISSLISSGLQNGLQKFRDAVSQRSQAVQQNPYLVSPVPFPRPPVQTQLPSLYTQGADVKRSDTNASVQLKGLTSNAFRYGNLGYKNADDIIKKLQTTKDWKGNTVNLYLDQDITKKRIGDLDKVIDWAGHNGLYVSLYPIAPIAKDGYADTDNPKFRDFPAQLAERYKDKTNVMYGLWAEPSGEMNDTWVPKAIDMAQTVREANPKQDVPIIMSGQYNSRDLDYLKDHPFPVNNTMYDFHDYPYANQSEDTGPPASWNSSKPGWMIGKQPVLQGEFGKYWGDNFSSPQDLSYMKQKLTTGDTFGLHSFGYALDEPGGLGLLNPNGTPSPKGQVFQQNFQQKPPTQFPSFPDSTSPLKMPKVDFSKSLDPVATFSSWGKTLSP